MGWLGVPMDTFNATTPILILAVAAGHAVQILKRYYEEYHHLRASGLAPREANHEAVIQSLARVGPVMLTAGIGAAIAFLSLACSRSAAIRTFGMFTAVGILSALVLELTFIPALRSLLRPPGRARAAARAGAHRVGPHHRHHRRLGDGPSPAVLAAAAGLALLAASGPPWSAYASGSSASSRRTWPSCATTSP